MYNLTYLHEKYSEKQAYELDRQNDLHAQKPKIHASCNICIYLCTRNFNYTYIIKPSRLETIIMDSSSVTRLCCFVLIDLTKWWKGIQWDGVVEYTM